MELKTALLPHQSAAVDKLRRLKVGALFMEQGTGKTRTTLELVKLRLDAGKIDGAIWLCPCSVKRNLALDIRKHADMDNGVITICGIETLSGSVKAAAELLEMADARKIMLIVDESSLVKNPNAIRSRRITALAGKCPYRLILNGTPVSRTEADLFQQFYILDWRILGYRSYYSFAANHLEYDEKFRGKIRRVLNTDYLSDKIAPYTFQIKKSECLTLPEKCEQIVRFDLAETQEEHYREVAERFLDLEILADEVGSSAFIYKVLIALQQVSSGQRILSGPLEPMRRTPFFTDPEDNPRIRALMEVIAETDGKAVIWCRFSDEIRDVLTVLERHGLSAVRFDGSVNQRTRQDNLAAFATDTRFLVANKTCAGYGLNLQFCRNAIYYNNDWDWGTRAQSEDRLHRIGQADTVMLWDIAANCSIDERILDCLSRKGNMADDFKAAINARNLSDWLSKRAESDLLDAGGGNAKSISP